MSLLGRNPSMIRFMSKGLLAQQPLPLTTSRGATQTRILSTYTERQQRLGRPLSPHVTIYAFPVTAISSIMVRVTGVSMSLGFGAIGALATAGADIPALIHCAQTNVPFFAPVSKFVVAFPIIYHYLGGVRHLVWDQVPTMLENAKVAQTSYAILGSAVALSLGAALYTIKAEDKEEEKH